MFKNYLKTSFRNLLKSGFHVITNSLGLGIGIALCILAFMFYAYNSEFNKCYSKEEMSKIYRLEYTSYENEIKWKHGNINTAHTWFIDDEIPGVESVIRYSDEYATVKSNDYRYQEFMTFFSPSFLESFPFELVKGSFREFNEPESIYLCEKLAQKFFPDESPVGKPISLVLKDMGKQTDFIVKGVFKATPYNSSFGRAEMFTNFDNLYRTSEVDRYDVHSQIESVVLLKTQTSDVVNNPVLLAKLNEFVKDDDPESKESYSISTFIKTYSGKAAYDYYMNYKYDAVELAAISLIAGLILLIGCSNYVIFALSLATKRIREIGLRKVTGGNKIQIMIQFMTESLLMCILATLCGLFFFWTIIPIFGNMLGGIQMSLSDFSMARIIIFLIVFTLFMAFVTGFYPALYITRFKPVEILSKSIVLKRNNWVTYSLITLSADNHYYRFGCGNYFCPKCLLGGRPGSGVSKRKLTNHRWP